MGDRSHGQISADRPAACAVPTSERIALTVLAGFDADAVSAVATTLQESDPELVVVSHDLSSIEVGVAHRIVRTASELIEDQLVTLAHGCAACALREDVLPALVRLAGDRPGARVVLVLAPAMEPLSVAAAVEYCSVGDVPVVDLVDLTALVTVVGCEHLADHLTTTDRLFDRGLAAADNDRRSVAEVVARQLEGAGTILLYSDVADASVVENAVAIVERISPWAQRRVVRPETAHHDVVAAVDGALLYQPDPPQILERGLEGKPVGLEAPTTKSGLVSTVFRSRRPFHPARLRDSLGSIVDGVWRSRGHCWIATQPDRVLVWESAGGNLDMGSLGPWIAAVPANERPSFRAARQDSAALAWDPYYEDRSIELAFIGANVDIGVLHRLLDEALLTDEELSEGPQTWRGWDDPFVGCFEDD